MFGVSSATEMFQYVIGQTLEGCEGVYNISDDIIVAGRDQAEHDERLDKLMARLEQCGLTINEKSVFGTTSLLYMGQQLSEAGLKIDNFKVKAVVDCEAPTSVSEVKSFLGLAQYCSKYITNFASVTDPLWELTRADQKFEGSKRQQNAFDKVKSLITEAPTLSYYNQKAKSRLITDASPVGLGAILEQEQSDGSYRPVMYASRSLTEVERRYAQFVLRLPQCSASHCRKSVLLHAKFRVKRSPRLFFFLRKTTSTCHGRWSTEMH